MELLSRISTHKPLEWRAYCNRCASYHTLPFEEALPEAQLLLKRLEQQKSIDIFGPDASDKALATARLFGEERGKMFGVLKCRTTKNQVEYLYAFSGQYAGRWQVNGWCPPLFDVDCFYALNDPIEKEIKAIGANLAEQNDPIKQRTLHQKRKTLSQHLMKEIHQLYQVHNFHRDSTSLESVFHEFSGGMPTGTGDCCAPKLLNQAAIKQLTPISLVEFYFGRENRSETRKHGCCYPPCTDKCAPILGYMLCGASV